LQLLSDAGLPAESVIVAATRHSAEKIGKGKSVGTITPGARADALLLDANPYSDVMHVVRPSHRIGTIRRGHFAAAN